MNTKKSLIQCSLSVCLAFFQSIGYAQDADTIQEKKSLAVFPAVSFAPETSLQLGGAAIWVLNNRPFENGAYTRQSTVSPFLIYTLKQQVISAINLSFFTSGGYFLDASVRFYNFPDAYYGLGNQNDPEIFERYTNLFFQVRGAFLKPLNRTAFVGISWDNQYNRLSKIEAGGRLASDHPDGLNGGLLLGIGPTYRLDSRDNTLYPTKGNLITVSTLFSYVGDYAYYSALLDVRKYLNLGDENILALQFVSNFTAGRTIPFYKLPQLGGDSRLRGIANASLYRDKHLVYTQVEYRRPLFWRLGMVAFAGVGDVAAHIKAYDLRSLKYVVGIGGRFAAIPKDRLNLRADLGISGGGQFGFYVGISEAF